MPERHARAIQLAAAMFERDTAVRALDITIGDVAPGRGARSRAVGAVRPPPPG